MKKDLNTITFGGTIKSIRTNEVGDTKVLSLMVESIEQYNSKGELKDLFTKMPVSIWGDLADINVEEGDQIVVGGKIATRSYEKDGEKKYVTEIKVNGFGGSVTVMKEQGISVEEVVKEGFPDDIPF